VAGHGPGVAAAGRRDPVDRAFSQELGVLGWRGVGAGAGSGKRHHLIFSRIPFNDA
jgi:hypothetical protein